MTDFNNLVPVTETTINGKLQQAVSAKQLHTSLNVGRDFSTWFSNRIEQYGLNQNEDYILLDYSPILMNQSTNNNQYSPELGKNTRRGRPEKDYLLTIGTAKELAMIENNEHGRAIRKYFIKCEEQLKQIAPAIHKKELKRLKARIEVADYSRPMCDALTIQRLSQGKETRPHHYTNEFDMINRIVLGTTASKYKKAHNITGDIRDHLNESTLYHLAYLERTNITLLDLNWDYEQRKAELLKLSQSYLSRLIGEVA